MKLGDGIGVLDFFGIWSWKGVLDYCRVLGIALKGERWGSLILLGELGRTFTDLCL